MTGATAAVECGTPVLASERAAPFDWIGVSGLPEGLGPVLAEVRATGRTDGESGGTATLLTFVRRHADGTIALQTPIHPSFRLAGGEVTVRIYSEAASCEPVPLTIAALEAAPGAMVEAANELRATVDEILAPVDAELSATDPNDVAAALARNGGELPLLSIPALWAMPEMVRLEGLLDGDALAEMSRADAEMLDAIAGRLELVERMRDFRDLVLVVRELTGEPVVTLAAETLSSGVRPDVASPFQFASHVPGAPVASASTSMPARQAGSCLEDRSNLFDIAEPAELDNLMRAQDYAERLLAGANDQEGGSASGTVFGDIGAVAGWVEVAGKAGKVASAVWDAFSTIVLNTAEAYTGLLPGEMQMTVMADPTEFEEDSEETGRWTASAVAASDGMKLTEKVIEKVMETALEKGLAEASIGKELTDGPVDDSDLAEELHEKVKDEIDEQLLEKPAKAALDALLESIGAKEVEGGFDIPGGCWTLGDMSASDAPAVGDGGSGTESGGSPPPLVTGHLSGEAVKFVESGTSAAREYEPVEAGTSRLEVRTAEGYRKTAASAAGLSVGTTYAFGGDQYTAVTRITVNEIEVQINPTIVRVEPGDRVDFVATVRNALDTRVRWRTSANPLDEIVDFGDGTHEAVLLSPDNPALYPITVEVESVSRGGARKDGIPVRKATALVQLADPIIEIQPAGGCISTGRERQFIAQIFGVRNQSVEWDHVGAGNLGDDGLFRATDSGEATIRATWVEDPDVAAEIEVEVEESCSYFEYTLGGDASGNARGHLEIMGVVGDETNRSTELRPGHCSVIINFEPEQKAGAAPLVLRGMVPEKLERGDYAIGNSSFHGMWVDVPESPGYFFGTIKNSGRSFATSGGILSVEYIDEERVEGSFSIQLKEAPPLEEYPEQGMATVRGSFSGTLEAPSGLGGWFYACG